ncbi:hypothetical protein KIMH_02020 [Bombiscardovia apis]|uniref:HTH tetR-type domain-containing protein n=1 Tax=Bombiscardovia apis TaxID=2932182 RepID=A0ABN6SFT3_9BIFI|nr:TetR/AcrR family transcriptional regulator [Bombiscardovia apis]BDR54091.1 hypothetical protein KIMH_02020 [Bombiscardovia apis]
MNKAEQRRKTGEALLNAAAHEFECRGYEETTLQDVANRLGLTRSTVLFHFKSKDKLRQNLIEWSNERISQFMEPCEDLNEFRNTLFRLADTYRHEAVIRAGLLLQEELVRKGETTPAKWETLLEQQFEIALSKQNRNGCAEIAPKASTVMFIAVMKSNVWLDDNQADQALSYLFTSIGIISRQE